MKLRFAFVLVALVLIGLDPKNIWGQSTLQVANKATQPKIHIVIIGVPKWKLSELKDSSLGGYITQACSDLVDFFQHRFPATEQIEFDPPVGQLCTEEATTYESIRHLLYVDLPSFGKDTLTFVFLISHGKVVPYGNKFLGQDLLFITSDATDAELENRSLSIGIELINWLQKIPAGSTVLTFVDTCNAGSIETLKVKLVEGLQDYFGLKLGLVVSSLSDQKAYKANFTEALLDLWKTRQCPPEKFEKWISDRIKSNYTVLDPSGYEGYPEIIFPYAGKWCLSELGTDGRLLFLYQGAVKNLIWKITADAPDLNFKERDILPGSEPFSLEIVPPGHYILTATSPGQKVKEFRVDLETKTTAPVYYNLPTTQREAYTAISSWRDSAKFKGVSTQDASSLDLSVEIVAGLTGLSTPNSDEWRAIGKPELESLLQATGGDVMKLHQLGINLFLNHDYDGAIRALLASAQASKDKDFRRETATFTYLIASSRGYTATATKIKKDFAIKLGPSTGSIESVAGRNETNRTAERLRAASTLQLITDLPKYLESNDLGGAQANRPDKNGIPQ